MSFLDRILPRKLVVQPDTRNIDVGARINSRLRRRATSMIGSEQPPSRGMWVHWQGRTGILTNLEPGDIATVMLVDDTKGENVLETHVHANELRQAYFEEIPKSRRPKADLAAALGYTRGAA